MRLSGSPMLVTGLAEQAPRPKRIGPLTLPLASFGDPLIAGVRRPSAGIPSEFGIVSNKTTGAKENQDFGIF